MIDVKRKQSKVFCFTSYLTANMDEKLGYFTYNCHEIYDRKFLKMHKEAAFKDNLGNFDLPPLAVG